MLRKILSLVGLTLARDYHDLEGYNAFLERQLQSEISMTQDLELLAIRQQHTITSLMEHLSEIEKTHTEKVMSILECERDWNYKGNYIPTRN
jgi:hypothetical protein